MSKELPKDWRWVKLREVCSALESGKRPKGGVQGIVSGIPSIGAEHLDFNGGFKFAKIKFVPDDFARQMKKGIVQKDDIIVVKDGATTGKVSFVTNNFPFDFAVINEHVFILRVTKNVLPLFAFYKIWSHKGNKEILEDFRGAAQGGISSGFIDKVNIPVPPKLTQQAIVSKIEELFSEIEKGIESLFTAQHQLKTYRQSVLKWAFEGKLTNENVKEGELPKGWKIVKTIDVIKIINNGYTPTSQYLSQGSGEVPFIKVYNLNFNGTLNFKKNPTFIPEVTHKKDLKRSICLPGDVLINIVGPPLGKVSVVTNQYAEWNINQAIIMFRPNENVLSKYISYFMQNPVTTNWLENTSKATAGQWNVRVSTCREIPFPFCSIEEQLKVVEEIESRLSVADKMEESINQSLQQAEALRQSILKKAFEGGLV